jgi:hypothetical protein
MKRFLTILVLPFVVGALATGASATVDGEYGWTVSDSFTDAFSNSSPFVPGVITLKLYYTCNSKDGMSAASFGIVSKNAANVILAVTAKNGYLNAGTGTNLLLAVGGCPDAQPQAAPRNAADILVLSNAPGEYGLVPNAIDGLKVTVDCQPAPAAWPIQWIGFTNLGGDPQSKDWDLCAPDPISVEAQSWGNVKAMYR